MKLITGRVILAGALAAAVAVGCKAREESFSSLRDNSGQTVTDTMAGGNGGSIDGTGKRVNYVQIDVPQAGIMTINISFSSGNNTGFTQPIDIRIYDQPNQSSPIASGTLTPGQYPSWLSGSATIGVKQAGPIFVLVDHKGQLDAANAQGDIWTQVIASAPSQSNVINYPGYFMSSEALNGNTINLKLAVPQAIVQLDANLTIFAASDKILDSNSQQQSTCNNCTAKMILTENNKEFAVPLNFNGQYIAGSALFKLAAGTYDVKFEFTGILPGSVIQMQINANPYRGTSGSPFVPGSAMGMMELTFDQNNSKKAIYDGKRFGYYVESDRTSETKFDLSLTVDRIMNNPNSSGPVGASMNAELAGPGGNYSNVVSNIALAKRGNNQFNGMLITDLDQGKYRLAFDGSSLDKTDILFLRGSMSVSNLSIPDGGPDFSTFQDLGTVTITPPNNYLVDLNVQSQPHTPAATPINLASKSVLEGMEMIRKEFHVRIPKGAQRGSRNNIDHGTIEACLGNTAEHWSDLIIHYYCQYGQARSCYTNTIRSKAQAIGGDQSLTQQQKIAKLQTIRLETYAECEATAQSDDEWKWLVQNQGKVFQYVMNSQTFAFDDEQQQAVINKFYRINDPSDKTECNQKRPRRAIDPTDGTHCQSKKIYNPAMTSVGR